MIGAREGLLDTGRYRRVIGPITTATALAMASLKPCFGLAATFPHFGSA